MPIQPFSSRPRAGRTALAALTAALWLSGSAASQAQAQVPAAPSEQASAPRQATITLEDLRRLVDEQRALIDRQGARLDAQDRDLADLRKRQAAVSTRTARAVCRVRFRQDGRSDSERDLARSRYHAVIDDALGFRGI